MDTLDTGSIVFAEFSVGRHPAIVLSTTHEIEADGLVRVVGNSSYTTVSLPEDLIEVPRRLGMKKSWVQCSLLEAVSKDKITALHRKAYGEFLKSVIAQVLNAAERAKKSKR